MEWVPTSGIYQPSLLESPNYLLLAYTVLLTNISRVQTGVSDDNYVTAYSFGWLIRKVVEVSAVHFSVL